MDRTPPTGRLTVITWGQQGEAGLTRVGNTELLIAPVEGKRPSPEADDALAGIESPFTFDREEHEIRRSVGMRGQDLAWAG